MLFRYGDYCHLQWSNKQVTYSNVLHHWVQDVLKGSVPLQGPQRQNGKHKHPLSLCDVFQVLNSSISLKIITPERQRSITTPPVWKLPSDGHREKEREGGGDDICKPLWLAFLPLPALPLLFPYKTFVDDDDDDDAQGDYSEHWLCLCVFCTVWTQTWNVREDASWT